MTFTLFGIDFYRQDRLFGIWIGAIKTEEWHRSFFTLYYDSDSFFIDLFWIRILTKGLLWGSFMKKSIRKSISHFFKNLFRPKELSEYHFWDRCLLDSEIKIMYKGFQLIKESKIHKAWQKGEIWKYLNTQK